MTEYKYKDIVSKAKSVVTNVEKNKKLGTSSTWSYYFAKAILKPKSDVTKITIANAIKSTGTKVNREIYKSTYVDMAKRLTSFVEKKKLLPNYVSLESQKGVQYRCAVRVYTYFFAKILTQYNNTGKFPQPIKLNTTNLFTSSYKKYGRSTSQGCDNRGQNNGYFCGPHMAQEIIRNLTGKVISQSTIASIMGTTTSGTGHSGIDTFFAWFNINYDYELEWGWKNFSDLGWSGVKKILESNNQDCGFHELYRNTWGHYTNFDAIYDNTIDVHNSLGATCSQGCYCGYTENRTKSEARSYLSGISQKSVIIVTRK